MSVYRTIGPLVYSLQYYSIFWMTQLLFHFQDDTDIYRTIGPLVYSLQYYSIFRMTQPNTYEPVHEETNNLGYQPDMTQTGLYSHRRWLEAGNFGFRK